MEQKKAFVRKHVFIDRKFQGRYMMTFLVPMLVLLGFFLFTLYFASQSIISTAVTIVKKDVDNIVSTKLQDQIDPPPGRYREIIDDVQAYIRNFAGNTEYRKAVLGSLLAIFGIGIFLIIIQIVLLTIFFSHRIAGPVYRLEKTCHNLIEGNYIDEIHLRKGDEMQNLAILMNDMARVTRERIAALALARNQAEKDDVMKTLKV